MNNIKSLTLAAVLGLSLSGCGDKNPLDILDVTNSVENDVERVLEKPSTSKQSNKEINKITPHQVKNQIQKVENETMSQLLDRIDNNNITKVEIIKSLRFAGKNELKYFIEFFKLNSQGDVVTLIGSIQEQAGIKVDYVLGENTLKYIYLNYYSSIDQSQLPHDITKRLDIYKTMLEYSKHFKEGTEYGTLYPSSVPNVFDRDYYYGDGLGENIEGTYLNQALYTKVEHKINEKGVVAKLFELNGRFVVAVYVDGEINILSYTTPGNPNIEGGIKTKTGTYLSKSSDLYHISTASASVSNVGGIYYGAVMPYAVNVIGGIYSHVGYVDGDKHSHGCIRLPYLYAEGVYNIFNKYGYIKRDIQDN